MLFYRGEFIKKCYIKLEVIKLIDIFKNGESYIVNGCDREYVLKIEWEKSLISYSYFLWLNIFIIRFIFI